MNTRPAVFALSALVLSSAAAAGGSSPPARFEGMDGDRDGSISSAEHAAAARSMFTTMDANRDDVVTAAEMTAAHEAVTGKEAASDDPGAEEKIRAVDTDGDGRLTAEEHAAASRAMFTTMDGDQDGALSRAEFDAGRAKINPERR